MTTWLAERVATLLEERAIPLPAAARDLAIERAHLASIIEGTRIPNANLTTRLAKYFGEPPETWLERSGVTAGGQSNGNGNGTHAPAGFVRVAAVGEVPDGEVKSVCEGRVCLINSGGEYYAIDDICPHAGAHLGEGFLDDEHVIECPWHAGRWDIRTGKMITALATTDILTYPVRITGDDIEVELPG